MSGIVYTWAYALYDLYGLIRRLKAAFGLISRAPSYNSLTSKTAADLNAVCSASTCAVAPVVRATWDTADWICLVIKSSCSWISRGFATRSSWPSRLTMPSASVFGDHRHVNRLPTECQRLIQIGTPDRNEPLKRRLIDCPIALARLETSSLDFGAGPDPIREPCPSSILPLPRNRRENGLFIVVLASRLKLSLLPDSELLAHHQISRDAHRAENQS